MSEPILKNLFDQELDLGPSLLVDNKTYVSRVLHSVLTCFWIQGWVAWQGKDIEFVFLEPLR